MDAEAVKRVLLADMALQNGAAGRDLTMATKRFRQAVFKTTFKKNKHMVSSVAPLFSRSPLVLCKQCSPTAISCDRLHDENLRSPWVCGGLIAMHGPGQHDEALSCLHSGMMLPVAAQILPGRRGKAPVIPVQVCT